VRRGPSVSAIATAANKLRANSFLINGEAVRCDNNGLAV
jgi:hypothetical protein